jgi:hypothetical protein
MSETSCCPYCGLALRDAADAARTGQPDGTVQPKGTAQPDGTASRGIEPLYREVRRIREIAEGRAAEEAARRIADLTRQVAELRATVARLRGPGVLPLPAAPSDRRAG